MKKLGLILAPFFCLSAFAYDNDALLNTKEQLRDPSQRAEIVKSDKEAKKIDAMATITVMGNKDYKEEMYAISAEILDWVVKQENPEKLMERYKADPVAFLKEMPKQQAQRIKQLADQIEQQQKAKRIPASVAP